MGSRLSTEQWDALRAEMERARREWYAELARDYRPEARRLLAAYETQERRIREALRDYEQALARGENVNEALFSLRNRIASELDQLRGAITDAAGELEGRGAAAGYRQAVDRLQAGGVSMAFRLPSFESIRAMIQYTESAGFRDAVERFGTYYAGVIVDEIISGQANGVNPREIVRRILRWMNEPSNQIVNSLDNMTRTVQLWSARRGTQMMYQQAGIEAWIWSSAADGRTCPGCWAMHGSVHPASEVLNDHHRGRCAMVPVTPRWRDLGISVYQDDPEPVRGETLFRELDADRQRKILGRGRYEAWLSGLWTFSPDDVTTYNDAIYGAMRRPKTLEEIGWTTN